MKNTQSCNKKNSIRAVLKRIRCVVEDQKLNITEEHSLNAGWLNIL